MTKSQKFVIAVHASVLFWILVLFVLVKNHVDPGSLIVTISCYGLFVSASVSLVALGSWLVGLVIKLWSKYVQPWLSQTAFWKKIAERFY